MDQSAGHFFRSSRARGRVLSQRVEPIIYHLLYILRKNQNTQVCSQAISTICFLLANQGVQRDVEYLLSILQGYPDAQVCLQAILILRRLSAGWFQTNIYLQERTLVTLLTQVKGHPESPIRQQICILLNQLSDYLDEAQRAKAINALLEVLRRDQDLGVCIQATLALRHLCVKLSLADTSSQDALFKSIQRQMKRDSDPLICQQALGLLNQLSDRLDNNQRIKAIDILLEALQEDRDPGTHFQATLALYSLLKWGFQAKVPLQIDQRDRLMEILMSTKIKASHPFILRQMQCLLELLRKYGLSSTGLFSQETMVEANTTDQTRYTRS